jgi:hypothetical protein
MFELLRFFIFVDRDEVFALFELVVGTDTIGLLSAVRFTDMVEFLRFFIFVGKAVAFRLLVLMFVVVLFRFTEFVVLILSFDAIALSAKAAPTESARSIENSIIPEVSAFFILSHLFNSNYLHLPLLFIYSYSY